ncbi:MAG: hypothetical protein WA813_09225 [Beijerinckiaceae bacterium]
MKKPMLGVFEAFAKIGFCQDRLLPRPAFAKTGFAKTGFAKITELAGS